MPDMDLGGDDLKYVSYSIIFTKPDLEATLQGQTHELVSYATTPESFGGLKIAHFFKGVAGHEVKRPARWKESNYPPDAEDETHWSIPSYDEKYVTFVFRVDQRLPKQAPTYRRDQVKALREISAKIG